MRRIILFVASLLVLISCNKEFPDKLGNVVGLDEKYAVTREIAYKVSRTVAVESSPQHLRSTFDTLNTLTVKDSLNRNTLYIVNYRYGTDSAAVIVSGDMRMDPVLAEIPHVFKTTDTLPFGLAEWISCMVDVISDLRTITDTFDVNVGARWTGYINPGVPNCGAMSVTDELGPLMTTRWGQSCLFFNTYAPDANCSGNTVDCEDKVPIGCYAVAIGQVMRYHEYPASYDGYSFDYLTMPNTNGNENVGRLLFEIAQEARTNWGCDGSGATDNNAVKTFKNFGYNNSVKVDAYDGNIAFLKNKLQDGPVILGGYRTSYMFGIFYGNGHAWVCDGYVQKENTCNDGRIGFHMNWGWRGAYNGLYHFGFYDPGTRSYNIRPSMIFNIKP